MLDDKACYQIVPRVQAGQTADPSQSVVPLHYIELSEVGRLYPSREGGAPDDWESVFLSPAFGLGVSRISHLLVGASSTILFKSKCRKDMLM